MNQKYRMLLWFWCSNQSNSCESTLRLLSAVYDSVLIKPNWIKRTTYYWVSAGSYWNVSQLNRHVRARCKNKRLRRDNRSKICSGIKNTKKKCSLLLPKSVFFFFLIIQSLLVVLVVQGCDLAVLHVPIPWLILLFYKNVEKGCCVNQAFGLQNNEFYI